MAGLAGLRSCFFFLGGFFGLLGALAEAEKVLANHFGNGGSALFSFPLVPPELPRGDSDL